MDEIDKIYNEALTESNTKYASIFRKYYYIIRKSTVLINKERNKKLSNQDAIVKLYEVCQRVASDLDQYLPSTIEEIEDSD